jgi:hypothetical protein
MMLLELLTCATILVHDGDTLRCDGQRVRLVAKSGPMDAPELPGSPRCHHCAPAPGYAARDRLRVILHPGEHEAWLRAPAEEAMALVQKYPADRLVVDRTSEPWFKRKAVEGQMLI